MKAQQKYHIKCRCSRCGQLLMTSREATKKEIKKDWSKIVFGASFGAPRCKKCGYSTFSDLNIGTTLKIYKVGSRKCINKEKFFNV